MVYARRVLCVILSPQIKVVKVKFTLLQAMKAQRWSRSIALNVRVCGQHHIPAGLSLGKPWYPL